MKRLTAALVVALVFVLLSGCMEQTGAPEVTAAAATPAQTAAATASPAAAPTLATPEETMGKGNQGDIFGSSGPDGTPANLAQVSGTIKKVNGALVLISTQSGGEFMLRFTGDTQWADGLDRSLAVGNAIACLVVPEPTFAPPSQGRVYQVLSNGKE